MREIKVLGQGFVRLRNISGPTRRDNLRHHEGDGRILVKTDHPFDADDVDPANVARMSFDGMDSGRTRADDLRLSRYLMKNKHTSPFEMVQVWLEMKIPIFVARQLVRHRTHRLNEVSGRYVTLPADWYVPELHEVTLQQKDKKQGGRLVDMQDADEVQTASIFRDNLNSQCQRSYDLYLRSVDMGVANEDARMFLHVNHFTHWVWNQDLHNLMHLLMLRDHGHAQGPTQRVAKAIDQLGREVLPETMALYDQFVRIKPPMTRALAIERLRTLAEAEQGGPLHPAWRPDEYAIQAVLGE